MDEALQSGAIEALLKEERKYEPSNEFKNQALIKDDEIYKEAQKDYIGFWAKQARELLDWFKDFEEVLDWDPPFAKWFLGGKLNVSYNCLDRHVNNGLGDKVAYYWEGEPGDTRVITYKELLSEVCKLANALTELGVSQGDRVAIYMPMIPELPVAMLACSRIGATHSVVFGGFSSEALRDRINDAKAKVLITADGGYRRGNVVALKQNADEALKGTDSIEKVIVVNRLGSNSNVNMINGRDVYYHELLEGKSDTFSPAELDSEHLLYLLYTSGTTAKPKGIMHTTAGYLTQVAFTQKYVFDIKPESDIYWCAADIGWVTGHSYIVYGPLCLGVTGIIYEGTPDYPDKDRWWSIIEKYKVTILYTAPTAIRTFMKWGTQYLEKHDLSSLRLLGSVGEPINPEAWVWYRENVGYGKTPVVDTWWQTETGAIMVAPLPGITVLKPGSASFALPGISVEVVDDNAKPVTLGGGYLTIKQPWPAMLRGLYGDPERYKETYWSRFPGRYFAGDGVKIDEEGYLWFLGRVDDVMNVSGHRVSTMEVESALVDHPMVAEAAVVGISDELTGQAIMAFVTPKAGIDPTSELGGELRSHVAKKIGAIARPKSIIFTEELPKTRSGKIMRRLLRDVAEGRKLGDTTTLADPSVVEEIKKKAARGED
jgi:acetyl-CoA synthetase